MPTWITTSSAPPPLVKGETRSRVRVSGPATPCRRVVNVSLGAQRSIPKGDHEAAGHDEAPSNHNGEGRHRPECDEADDLPHHEQCRDVDPTTRGNSIGARLRLSP